MLANLKPGQLPRLIDYYRGCYREDSYDLSISNVDKSPKDRCIVIEDEDVLACGSLPRLPVVKESAELLRKQADIYRKERLLIYGCLMIYGRLESKGGFTQYREIHSPLLYFPASLAQDEDLFAHIDENELRVNFVLLRQLLKPDINTEVMDTFPAVSWPLCSGQVTLATVL